MEVPADDCRILPSNDRHSPGKHKGNVMGYNRSGEARKQRLKRQKREIARLVAKLESKPAPKAAAAPPKKAPAKK